MKRTLFILFMMSLINNAEAISISEIMYDPAGSDTGREWVEIYNDTSSDIDLTSYKFNESGTNHGVTAYSSDKLIKANGYGIIADNPAKFLIDYPNFSGILYDSSFSLSNTGELIILKDSSLNQIDSINYSSSIGGNDDGSTLSFINGNWLRGKATPGEANIEEVKATTTENTSFTISPVTSVALPDIYLLLEDKVNAIAGADKVFSVKAINSFRNEIDGLNYTWTFGDGGIRTGKNVTYHYSYPGAYNVVVEASGNGYYEKGRSKAFVVAPELFISKSDIGVGGLYIDIKNDLSNDVDLSDWILDINSNFYVMPKNTILSGNKVTRLSGNALGISTSTINLWQKNFITTRLLYPDHSVMLKFTEGTSSINNLQQIGNTTEIVIEKPIIKILGKPKQIEAKSEIATTTIPLTPEVSKKDTRIVDFIKVFLVLGLNSFLISLLCYNLNIMEEKKYEKFIFIGDGSVGDHGIITDYANRFYESTKIPSLILMKDDSKFLTDLFIPYRDHISYINMSGVSRFANIFSLALSSIFHDYCYLDIIPHKASFSYKMFAYFIRFFTKSRFVGFNLENTKNFPQGKGSCYFLGKYNYIPPNLDKEYFHEQANRLLKFLGFDSVDRPPMLDYIKQEDIFDKYEIKEREYIVFHLCSSHPDRSLPTDRWNKIISNLRADLPDTKFVFTGGSMDYKFTDEVLANIPSPNNVLAYSLPMQELLTIYANAKTTVTVHTGNAILMNMLHIPLVVLNIRGINIFKRYFSENTIELTSADGCTCNPFEEECSMINYKGINYMACIFNIKDEDIIEATLKKFKGE